MSKSRPKNVDDDEEPNGWPGATMRDLLDDPEDVEDEDSDEEFLPEEEGEDEGEDEGN